MVGSYCISGLWGWEAGDSDYRMVVISVWSLVGTEVVYDWQYVVKLVVCLAVLME